LIDRDGRRIVECKFDDIRTFDGGIAPARIGGDAGFIDRDGSWVIEPQFKKTFGFVGDLAVVRMGRSWSYINRAGRVIWTSNEGARILYPPAPLFY
jgi:hypothetical protein